MSNNTVLSTPFVGSQFEFEMRQCCPQFIWWDTPFHSILLIFSRWFFIMLNCWMMSWFSILSDSVEIVYMKNGTVKIFDRFSTWKNATKFICDSQQLEICLFISKWFSSCQNMHINNHYLVFDSISCHFARFFITRINIAIVAYLKQQMVNNITSFFELANLTKFHSAEWRVTTTDHSMTIIQVDYQKKSAKWLLSHFDFSFTIPCLQPH